MATNKPTFEIGLVMAGAVSAGAYTAGVLDYLYQALESWYQSNNDDPPFDIKIKVLTGTSAGGMCTTISGLLFCDKPDYLNSQKSKLYKAWVDEVDIAPMLTSNDLKAGVVKSLLNSQIIDEIADAAFRIHPGKENLPKWVANDLHLLLTVTNTKGISYAINFKGNQTNQPSYIMTNHRDYFHFHILKDGIADSFPDEEFNTPMDLDLDNQNLKNWDTLKNVTKATGAFPIGLEARPLTSPSDVYKHRYPPHIPINNNAPTLDYLAIDGGIINNEPFELAHTILAGGKKKINPRQGTAANRAVIMVDPFPSQMDSPNNDNNQFDITNVASSLFGSLRNQALFKPKDLELALDENVFSRFIIAPKRKKSGDNNGSGKYQVAGGALHAFSGFLSRDFREHDYHLGRRNAQRFLKRYFILPENNELFKNWDKNQRSAFYVKDASGHLIKDPENKEKCLPVIPVLNADLAEKIPSPKWPQITEEEFEKSIKAPLMFRAKALGEPLFSGWFGSFIWNLYLSKKAGKFVVNAVEDELRDAGLLVGRKQ